jgi:hypothetical protein
MVGAEELDRPPEVKLGPAAKAMERRAAREAEAGGRAYAPVTERGRAVHEAREARRVFSVLREELRERVAAARDAYGAARGEGQDRASAGLKAMCAALEKQRAAPEAGGESVGDRLRRMLGREAERPGAGAGRTEPDDVRARLDAALGRQGEGNSIGDYAKTEERSASHQVMETGHDRRRDEPSIKSVHAKIREYDDGYER